MMNIAKAATRLILTIPIRTEAEYISINRKQLYGKFELLKGFKQIQPLPSSIRRLYVQKCYTNNYCITTRSKFVWGSMFGASVIIGLICSKPGIAYAMNGFDIWEDDHQFGLSDASSVNEYQRNLLAITRKIMLPSLLFLTVVMNWSHPAILAVKVILILVGTKPSPLSIYVSIEQLRRRYMREQPILFRFKSLYANKVEVEDYVFLCLARVELKDQKFTLVGILGHWWVFSRQHLVGIRGQSNASY